MRSDVDTNGHSGGIKQRQTATRLKWPKPRKTVVHGNTRWLVRQPKSLGSQRLYFDTQEAAEKKIAEWRRTAGTVIRELSLLPQSSQALLIALVFQFNGDILRLKQAAEKGEPLLVKTKPITVTEVVTECLKAKKEANVRGYYLKMLTYILELFAKEVGVLYIQQVDAAALERWRNIHTWSPRTWLSNVSFLRVFFSFAVKRRYIATNPVKDLELPLIEHKPPLILTVKQARTLMQNCRKRDPKLVPFLAIQLFAGVRPHEARRISWSDIKNGHIRIESHQSKTRRRRLVTVNPVLKAWLKLGGELPLKTQSQYLYARIKRLTTDDKGKIVVPWSHDVLRHTAASMLLPIQGAWQTALELGHSEQILFRHYRELVTRQTAEAFFKIFP